MNLEKSIASSASEMIDVDHLSFDVTNPRFTPDKKPENNKDEAIIAKLASSADLAELVQSIATSGYINIEPLVVILRNETLVVLEGNRRLAAVVRRHGFLDRPQLELSEYLAHLFVDVKRPACGIASAVR